MEYHRSIVFTKAPLSGCYRFRNEFQILPLSLPDVPRPKGIRDFPNILEYAISENEKIAIVHEDADLQDLNELSSLTATTVTKRLKIVSLLSAFTNNLFFDYNAFNGFWGIPILSEEMTEIQASVWCMQMFHFPDQVGPIQIQNFTDHEIGNIERMLHKPYYVHNPNLDFDHQKVIIFPNTIDLIFDSYFNLEPSIQVIVDSAVSYAVSAVELKERRKTLSLLSSFTSVETMVNLEFNKIEPEQCETCGQLKFSIAKKFREYLLKYIGTSDANKRKFNKYYSLRSKIVHTGEQLKTELLWADVENEESSNESITRYEILQLGRLSIVNWLIKNRQRN